MEINIQTYLKVAVSPNVHKWRGDVNMVAKEDLPENKETREPRNT